VSMLPASTGLTDSLWETVKTSGSVSPRLRVVKTVDVGLGDFVLLKTLAFRVMVVFIVVTGFHKRMETRL